MLNIWEYFDMKFLRHDNFHAYLMASDIAALVWHLILFWKFKFKSTNNHSISQLTICGCALRFPIYISNDNRIRKAICRAFIRCHFCCSNIKPEAIAKGQHEAAEQFLEKYSIVIVSNSLKSNLTAGVVVNDWPNFGGKSLAA